MEVKDINQKYVEFLKDYGEEVRDKTTNKVTKEKGHKHTSYVKRTEKKIANLSNNINKLKRAKKDFAFAEYLVKKGILNSADKSAIDTKLKDNEKDLKELRAELIKKKDEYEKRKEELDKLVEEVRQDPSVKAQLDTAMAKKYDRKMVKLEEKRTNAINGKKNMEVINTLSKMQPLMKKTLAEVIKLEAEKKNIIDQIKMLSTKDPDYNTKLSQMKAQIKTIDNQEKGSKENILSTIKSDKPDFSLENLQDSIDRMIDNRTVLNNGEIQVDETLKRTLTSYNREIKSTEKQLLTNQVAYAKLGIVIENPKSDSAQDIKIKKSRFEKDKLQQEIDEAKKTEKDRLIKEENARRNKLVPKEDLKWYQFRKRFKKWIDVRKAKKANKVPVEEAIKEKIEKAEEAAEKNVREENDARKQAKTTMRESLRSEALKYDVVKQVLNERKKESWKDAKDTIKNHEDEER